MLRTTRIPSGANVNRPDASGRMNPPRRRSWWLGDFAEPGTLRVVFGKSREYRIDSI
jgi:hypothetical protein